MTRAVRRLRAARGAAPVRRLRDVRDRVPRRAWQARSRRRSAPGATCPSTSERSDLALIGTASFKLSRLISKKKVTSFVRAPFTELEGKGGPAELEEHPRGSGLRRAMGELLVCPYCLGLWASGAFHAGLLFAPRATRFSASVLAAMTISDFLQIAYKAAEERGLED